MTHPHPTIPSAIIAIRTITNVISVTNDTTGAMQTATSLDNDTQIGHTFTIQQLT